KNFPRRNARARKHKAPVVGGGFAGWTFRAWAELLLAEVEVPPSVVPFERDFTPAERNLRVGVERTDVRPGGWRVLAGVGDGSIVRVRRVGRPRVARHVRLVIANRSHPATRIMLSDG